MVEALVRIGPAAVEPLIDALKDIRSRHGAAEALGRLGDAQAIEPLIAALSDKTNASHTFGEMSADGAIVTALGQLGDARAVEPLIEALKVWWTAKPAALALGQLGDARAVEPLIETLKNEKAEVREAATTSLTALGWRTEPARKAETARCVDCKYEGKYFDLPVPFPIELMLGMKLGMPGRGNGQLVGFEEEA